LDERAAANVTEQFECLFVLPADDPMTVACEGGNPHPLECAVEIAPQRPDELTQPGAQRLLHIRLSVGAERFVRCTKPPESANHHICVRPCRKPEARMWRPLPYVSLRRRPQPERQPERRGLSLSPLLLSGRQWSDARPDAKTRPRPAPCRPGS